MKILVTGGAGFIGSILAWTLAGMGHSVLSIDNLSEYYSPLYKRMRLYRDGFAPEDIDEAVSHPGVMVRSQSSDRLWFMYGDVCDDASLEKVFATSPEAVVHLAAQPGVRFSQNHPNVSVRTNIAGFFNVIECARMSGVSRFLYASSSSVYGNSLSPRFGEKDMCNAPLSVYAASKICDEAIATSYSNAYGMDTIGVRMFSVYGPWGRPDMAPLKFADAICRGEEIELYGGGVQTRDFTYIDDVVESLCRLVALPSEEGRAEVFNIGSSKPVRILELLKLIEDRMVKRASYVVAPEQRGEARLTYSDTSKLLATTGYQPHTKLCDGVEKMLDWYDEICREYSLKFKDNDII